VDINHRYFFVLGRFMHCYAQAEKAVQLILFATAGITVETGRALFSGTRAKDATSLIRRLHEVRSTSLPQSIDDALRQFGTINDLRDGLVHSGVERSPNFAPAPSIPIEYAEDSLLLTNRHQAHARRTLKEHLISPNTVERATNDILTINGKLDLYLHDLMGGGPLKDEEIANVIASRPYFYRSPQPTPARDKTKGKSSTRPPRQRSSRL
jgi:hypothetical protein